MKRILAGLMALCLMLSFSGCAKKQPKEYHYRLQQSKETREEKTDDGATYFSVRYELPRLVIVDGDGNDAGDDAPEEMKTVQKSFNDGVREEVDELFVYEELAGDALQNLADSETYGFDFLTHEIELTTPEMLKKEHFISVFTNGYVYLGGAHPWYLIRGWNYDLDRGEFVTWEDLTDADDAMRAFLSDRIFAQIDEQGLREYFFDDMEEYVRKLEYTEMYFDERGLNVLFEEESIGPHAAGIPAFFVTYDQLAPYLNERAVKLLELGDAAGAADPLSGAAALAQGMPAYRAVLNEGGTFFSTDANRSLTIGEIDKALADYEDISVAVKQFAVADLDGDGKQEVVLALDTGFDGFFEVLREENGTVYGYTLVYRAMQALKENGLFSYSSGAYDSGFGRMRFLTDGCELVPLTYSESSSDGAGDPSVSYFVNNVRTSEEECRKAFDEFWQMPDAVWYEFSSDNVDAILK